jgi:hypothetical protein
MTRIIAITVMNSVTPNAAAKHELFFNETSSEVGLLNI